MNISEMYKNFIKVPPGYGEIPFYWWVGEKLTKERLLWQLEKLEKIKPSGLQVNYCHTDKGGNAYGLTYKSDPELFSKEWWDLFTWWAAECNKRGIAVSLSDYTLGIVGQGYWMDEILSDAPEMTGRTLESIVSSVKGPGTFKISVPENVLKISAVGKHGTIHLDNMLCNGELIWNMPQGDWKITLVYYRINKNSVNPLHPDLGKMVIDKFFKQFEDHMPGQAGKGLNYFFSDELTFGVGGKLWTDGFAEKFKAAKGYDIIPLLHGLFIDIGKITAKLRIDYYDLLISLSEEAYFKPVFEWHEKRGMLYGCDHGGRGTDITEFGDYFRTQRWMSGPGCDQPYLENNVVKNKVASSIAHLYKRPRVWLEGFHSSGWGTSSENITRATFENFASGQNLLSLHGLFYTLRGGWWEWAPPCNHFRMPYWEHIDVWAGWLERISYMMSQGVHRCDVAIIYPVATVQADMNASNAVSLAFKTGTALFEKGLDFDFIDAQSLDRCEVSDRELKVSDEKYQVLIIPGMNAINYSNIEKALEFYRAGGMIIALGILPEASDREGSNDPVLKAMIDEMFRRPDSRGIFMPELIADELEKIITRSIRRDFLPNSPCRVNHRTIGNGELFMISRGEYNMECKFRAGGKAELWDPWTGKSSELPIVAIEGEYSKLRLPLTKDEAQFIVFTPGNPLRVTPKWPILESVFLGSEWEFELKPTLDNRWGDFRLPASRKFIGAEARRFRYSTDNGKTESDVLFGVGSYFMKTGPLPENADLSKASWSEYKFSWREGVPGDPGHQGYHGLKESVSDEFIVWGKAVENWTQINYVPEKSDDDCYFFKSSLYSEKNSTAKIIISGNTPDKIIVNGKDFSDFKKTISLKKGSNSLLLRFRGAGRAAVVFIEADAPEEYRQKIPLAMNWYKRPGLIPFDINDGKKITASYFFTAPPGLREIKFHPNGKIISASIDGKPLKYENGSMIPDTPALHESDIIINIELDHGVSGGSAFDEPIELSCGKGIIRNGDWSKNGVLANYSGGSVYSQTFRLNKSDLNKKITLDLGEICSSVEIKVNGISAGIKLAPPWTVDISKLVNAGDNRLELIIFNTLANHYSTVPTRYNKSSTKSGLIGPVKLIFATEKK